MKTLESIYKDLLENFKKKTNIDIAQGTALDFIMLSAAESIYEAYEEIENSKNPHIYTNLQGKNIDKLGYLIGCTRRTDETDASYLYRCMNWKYDSEKCNSIAISNALSNLEYSSIATYVPFTQGTGSATVYIIPKEYDEETERKAIEEVSARLLETVSPDTFIKYEITEAVQFKCVLYASISSDYDIEAIKKNIEQNIKKYVNSIAIGDYLSYGDINKIGLQEEGVNYFNATHIYLDDILLANLKTIQTVNKKFLYYDVIWELVED